MPPLRMKPNSSIFVGMSKRALRKYVAELNREALAEQLLDLYERFPEVKTYYDFVFNPREDALLRDAKIRISKEYAPRGKRKPKARRSVAQKYIRQFRVLGVDPALLADLMAFNLETASRFERTRRCPDAFYRSMYNSCREWAQFLVLNGLWQESAGRFEAFLGLVRKGAWPNRDQFEALAEQLEINT